MGDDNPYHLARRAEKVERIVGKLEAQSIPLAYFAAMSDADRDAMFALMGETPPHADTLAALAEAIEQKTATGLT